MILLYNLNSYVGGGETLLIRLAQYLHRKTIPYQILAAKGNCWIASESNKLGLNCAIWPTLNDSIIYQGDKERELVINAIAKLYEHQDELRVFTFCMRDLHNALYIFTRLPEIRVCFSHGIYHPEDVFYLSSFSLNSKGIIERNRKLIRELHDAKAVLFVNQNGLKVSLSSLQTPPPALVQGSVFAPLPIPLLNDVPHRDVKGKSTIRIVCISRFVIFKVAAILAIMRYAKNRSGVELIVIGHGSLKFILTSWMKFVGAKNVKIITGVSPAELDDYIDTCDIGYAQGTSILEIAKRGLPVLIAPYSRLRDLFNHQFPTLGIFGDIRDSSAFGDVTDLRGFITYSISDCIDKVIASYDKYHNQTVECVKTFSSSNVCPDIVDFINKADYTNQRGIYEPPSAPIFKRCLKYLLSRRG